MQNKLADRPTGRSTEHPAEMNPRKVRAGLIVVGIIFASSLVLIFVADGAVAKAIFFAVAAMTLARSAMLVRWLRRNRR